MSTYLQQSTNSLQSSSQNSLTNSVSAENQSEQLMQQATQDALWRMAQNNAMAKLKGMNKLANDANQLN